VAVEQIDRVSDVQQWFRAHRRVADLRHAIRHTPADGTARIQAHRGRQPARGGGSRPGGHGGARSSRPSGRRRRSRRPRGRARTDPDKRIVDAPRAEPASERVWSHAPRALSGRLPRWRGAGPRQRPPAPGQGWVIGQRKSAAGSRTTVTSPALSAAMTASSEVNRYGEPVNVTRYTAQSPPV
jgi:hypothetical protein